MQGRIKTYDDELCVEDSETKSRYPIHNTSIIALKDYEHNHNKIVRIVDYTVFTSYNKSYAIILNLV